MGIVNIEKSHHQAFNENETIRGSIGWIYNRIFENF